MSNKTSQQIWNTDQKCSVGWAIFRSLQFKVPLLVVWIVFMIASDARKNVAKGFTSAKVNHFSILMK